MKKFLEDMVYNNFLLRAIISILILIIYIIFQINIFILFSLGLVIYLIIFFELIKYFKNFLSIIFIFLIISFISYAIYFYSFFNIYIFNFFIFIIIFFDIFSYLVGSFFGKNYIFKKISPNKTFEGYVGGLILANIFYFIFIFFYNDLNISLHMIILLNIIIIFSIFGDLIQSLFKRKNNIKDSSNFLPGHGGILDRLDGIYFGIPIGMISITLLF